jgi:hypothetical protein
LVRSINRDGPEINGENPGDPNANEWSVERGVSLEGHGLSEKAHATQIICFREAGLTKTDRADMTSAV